MTDWNGLPDQPERSGMYLLKNGGFEFRVHWDAEKQGWDKKGIGTVPASYYSHATLIGEVLTSSELAQMRKDERERCSKACDKVSAKSHQKYTKNLTGISGHYWLGANDGSIMCANAIRALTKKPPHE